MNKLIYNYYLHNHFQISTSDMINTELFDYSNQSVEFLHHFICLHACCESILQQIRARRWTKTFHNVWLQSSEGIVAPSQMEALLPRPSVN